MKPTSTPLIAEDDRLWFKMRRSPATAALIVVFALVFVATVFDSEQRIFTTFAKVNDRIRAGEVWRLFTASFLHAGILHIWFNGTALASVGPAIERVYGKLQFLVAFLLGGAAGMLASVLFVPAPSVGASAGVFSLLGVLLAYAFRSRGSLAPQVRKFLIVQVLVVVGLNVALGLLLAAFIDNAAHIGGLVGGLVLGFLLRPMKPLFSAVPQARQAAAAPAPTKDITDVEQKDRLDVSTERNRGGARLFEGYMSRHRVGYWATVPGIILAGALLYQAQRFFEKPPARIHVTPAAVECITFVTPSTVTVKLTPEAAARLESITRESVGRVLVMTFEGVDLFLSTRVREPNRSGMLSFPNAPEELLRRLRVVAGPLRHDGCR